MPSSPSFRHSSRARVHSFSKASLSSVKCRQGVNAYHGRGPAGDDGGGIDERETQGVIAGSIHTPYEELEENIRPGGMLHALAAATGKRLVFYCAFGERSAMAVEAAQEAGLASACHIQGGVDAWKKAKGSVVH